MGFDEFVKKIKKADTPVYAKLKKIAKGIKGFEPPAIPGLHSGLYWEQRTRINALRGFSRACYYQPMFRKKCATCGEHLHIVNSGQGLPWLVGRVDIHIGNNVQLYDKMTILGLTVGDNPTFIVGNNTKMSQPTSVFVGNEVSIGENCLIGCTMITDNPGHRMNYLERMPMPVERESIGTIRIGDYVWAALESMVIGNVTVGTGAILAARSVVTKDVPPFCVAAGSPAKIVKKLDFPDEMREKLGPEEYKKYDKAKIGK